MPRTPAGSARRRSRSSAVGLLAGGAVAVAAIVVAAVMAPPGRAPAPRPARVGATTPAKGADAPPASAARAEPAPLAVATHEGAAPAALPARTSEPAATVSASDAVPAAAPELASAPEPARLPDVDAPLGGVVTSWVGNSFPHGAGGTPSQKWVPQNASDIFVTADGTVYTNVFWEEGGGNQTQIKDGDVIAQAQYSRGWGHEGGECVAANAKYVYYAQKFDNEGGGLKDPLQWPPKGSTWFGVTRRNRSNIRTGDPFDGGKGGKESVRGSFRVVHEIDGNGALAGLYATDEELFVSCPYDGRIRVYDANTMQPRREFAVEKPGDIFADARGSLWVVVGDGTRIVRYSAAGSRMPQAIVLPAGTTASDLCIDARGRMLVADGGPRAEILIVEGLDGTPRVTGTFGVEGGVFAPPRERGRVGDRRLQGITGVGADAAGNVYVANSLAPFSGLRLESYAPGGKLVWRLCALEFVSRACEDPGDQSTLYSQATRYAVDYAAGRGKEWSLVAYTYDRATFPHEVRECSPLVRRVEGRKLVYSCGQNSASPLGIYRFEPDAHGEIAIPCGLFAEKQMKGVPNAPPTGGWVWIDLNGDGQFDANEFSSRGRDEPWAGGYWVDERGDVWFAGGDVRRFALQGFTARGVPRYDLDHVETFAKPAPFDAARRVRYDAANDVMYLGGTTREHRNQHWKGMGPVLCRYERFCAGNREPRWTVVGTYDRTFGGGHVSCEPLSFDVAGEYAFVALAGESRKLGIGWAHIDVYELASGRKVGWIEPSKDIGQVGLMDMVECLRAYRRPDGEYVVLEEDDYAAKNLMFRWRPERGGVR